MPRKPRAYRRVKCADGPPAPSFVAEGRCFRANSAELLEGDEMSMEALVDAGRRDSEPSSACQRLGQADPTAVPSLLDLVRIFAKSTDKKAVGEDAIGGEAYAVDPWLLAELWHPLFVKASVSLRPPLQFRGGMLTELLKAGNDGAECAHYVSRHYHYGSFR